MTSQSAGASEGEYGSRGLALEALEAPWRGRSFLVLEVFTVHLGLHTMGLFGSVVRLLQMVTVATERACKTRSLQGNVMPHPCEPYSL